MWRGEINYPTLRKEREGWGTRQLVAGIEPKSAFLPLLARRLKVVCSSKE
jgi:hypothetical protein